MTPLAQLPAWLDAVVALLLVAGTWFGAMGSFALVRLPGFFPRLHGPTKASTLGVGCVGLASALMLGPLGRPSVHEILIAGFIFLTAPISAHLLVKAALHLARREEGKD